MTQEEFVTQVWSKSWFFPFDIRQKEKVKHKLVDILFLVVSAVICGCNEWKETHLWASWETNVKWLKKYIELENGSHL
jgi:hypothetical protein